MRRVLEFTPYLLLLVFFTSRGASFTPSNALPARRLQAAGRVEAGEMGSTSSGRSSSRSSRRSSSRSSGGGTGGSRVRGPGRDGSGGDGNEDGGAHRQIVSNMHHAVHERPRRWRSCEAAARRMEEHLAATGIVPGPREWTVYIAAWGAAHRADKALAVLADADAEINR